MNKIMGIALITLVALFSVFYNNSLAAERLDGELILAYLSIDDKEGLEEYLTRFEEDPKTEDIRRIAKLNDVGEEKEVSSGTFVQGAGKIIGGANSLLEEMSRETGIPILDPNENSEEESAMTISGQIMGLSRLIIESFSLLTGIPVAKEENE